MAISCRLSQPRESLEVPVYVYPAIRPDTVAIPLGQGHSDYGRYARNRGTNPVNLIGTETDETGEGLTWTALRVQIKPTGRRVEMAAFESRLGVTEGFTNEDIPG